MLTLHPLTVDQVAYVYNRHMRQDFAADELKPLAGIKQLMQQGCYKGYGLFENGDLSGYALLMTLPGERVVLLDYYAIVQRKRGRGYGSRFLTLLRRELAAYDGVILESERVQNAVGWPQKNIRIRRIAFYHRNGARTTCLYSRLFDVDFSVLYMPCARDLPDGRLYQALDALYRALFPPYLWQKKVELGMRACSGPVWK